MMTTHKKTQEVLDIFAEISKVPRCSKKEEKIAAWLADWARRQGFSYEMDEVRNIRIDVPATPGHEHAPIVVIQGHMDMVCEKTPESQHNFCTDPIKLVVDGEWLKAEGTTLGADNGIALAMAMAFALDKEVVHGPMELLFTVDEETGLTGANALKPGFIKGKLLINVDSEDEGVFTVGCAGGINTRLRYPWKRAVVASGKQAVRISVGQVKGGHSGIDIATGKANALKLLARVLDDLSEKDRIQIGGIRGGSAHNAIPRDAWALLWIQGNLVGTLEEVVAGWQVVFRAEYAMVDPDIRISWNREEGGEPLALSEEDSLRLIKVMMAFPHGVAAMSQSIPGLVETSNNFASIWVEDETLNILSSQRSSVVSRLNALTRRIETMGPLGGGQAESGEGYPPWQPDMKSPLLARSTALYEKLFGKKPVVEIMHAGLECGIIGDRNPGMDMISIGPDLKFPHCPDEKVSIPAIGKVWDFMAALLKDLA